MKKTVFAWIFLMVCTLSFAQSTPKFAVGISTDFLSLPLTKSSLLTQPTDVYVAFLPTKNLGLMLGYDAMLSLDPNTPNYDQFGGIMLGAGYTVWRDKSGYFSNEITASATNALDDFASFKNYHANLGMRFKFMDAFFLGTGLRWTQNESNVFSVSPVNSLNLYFQLGVQFYIGKNPLLTKTK